jgi:carbonic anhydrase
VAGNGLGTEALGSLKYAVDHLGGTLKLIVVLGHSGCGALTAAVDMFLTPGDYLTLATKHSLRNILDRSLLVVQASANKLLSTFGSEVARNPGYRQALIESSIITNAALAAHSIRQEFELGERREIRAVYGVYLLETREVWAPHLGTAGGIGLASAPHDVAGFAGLANAVVQSGRIASLLNPVR